MSEQTVGEEQEFTRFLVMRRNQKSNGCNTLLHVQLANDCLDRYFQYGPFFVHIQLAVDHAKNYYSL